MKASFINTTHIEGLVYDHDLQIKVSGPESKAPNTEFITGTVSIATDNAVTNIIAIHFTYIVAKTSKGTDNNTFTVLKNIIDGTIGTYMKDGPEKAGKIRVDSAIALNEFYTDRNGKEELVSTKRNEGGFVHTCDFLVDDERNRNTFKCDMLITNATRIEANPEKNIPERVIVKGCVFDFRKALLPVEFTATSTGAMNYFEDLGASPSNPTLTCVWGNQISEVVVNRYTEESAFGEPSVREVKSTRRDFVITGASKEPQVWDDESTITAAELKEAIAARETYLATIKTRQAEYKAKKAGAATPAAPSNSAFNF